MMHQFSSQEQSPVASLPTAQSTSPFGFGRWVFMLRKSRRLSRQAVSKRASAKGFQLSQQYVHFIETEKATNIGSDKIQALSAGLGVPLAVIEQAVFNKSAPVFYLRGRVSAGRAGPGNNDEYGEGVPYFDAAHLDADSTVLYYVEIMGDSMSPKIEHGDLALIRPMPSTSALKSSSSKSASLSPPVESAALIENSLIDSGLIESGRIYLVQQAKRKHHTCKYVVRDVADPETFWLLAENEELFPKTKLDKEFKILGEVIEVRKSMSLYRPTLNP